jgi:MFS family permease
MTNTSPIFLPDLERAERSGRRRPRPGADPSFRFPWVGILTLAACVFLSVTSEMLPTGLLSEMSGDLGVEESRVGLLVSVFAVAVVVSSAPLAALTRRVPRHALLLAVLAVFATSNLLTAIAPTFELVTATRVLGGLAHGLFWAVVGAYSAHLVPPALIGRAVALTVGGGSLAFVLGVPVGTAAGQGSCSSGASCRRSAGPSGRRPRASPPAAASGSGSAWPARASAACSSCASRRW